MRFAMTSNLKKFPKSALLDASALLEQVALSDDKDVERAEELVINYNPETQNVFISDSKFNIWFKQKYGYKLIMHTEEEQTK